MTTSPTSPRASFAPSFSARRLGRGLVAFVALVASGALGACAAPSEEAAVGEGNLAASAGPGGAGASSDEATTDDLVGRWFTETSNPVGGYARLELRADGTFAAVKDVSAMADCLPTGTETRCLGHHEGTYSVGFGATAGLHLRFVENGRVVSEERVPARRIGPSTLELRRARGVELLTLLPDGTCAADVDCGAGACEAPVCLMYCSVDDPGCCGPRTCAPAAPKACTSDADCGAGRVCPEPVCLMYCSVDDPGCCGPRTCEPAPPQTGCWGAWLDERGACRAPNDGMYPAACCPAP